MVGLGGLGLLDGDDAVVANLLHGLGDQLADGLVARGDGAHAGDVVAAVDLLAVLADGVHSGIHGLGHALLHDDGVGAGGQVPQTLVDDGLGQQGGGGRPSWMMDWASRVAVVVPSPATSLVLVETSFTS